ncbi:MAG: PAS domain S-box protein [Myxococcales bacterium]|nr:PAS domain S-box protein [Myxococcales bacterium]
MHLATLVERLEAVDCLLSRIPNTAIIVYDTNYYFHFLTGPALDESGFPKARFYRKTLQQAFTGDEVDALKPLYDRVLAGEEFELDFRGTNNVDYRVRLFPVVHRGEVVGGANLVVQVSTQEFEMFREIVRSSTDGIELVAEDGECLWANEAAQRSSPSGPRSRVVRYAAKLLPEAPQEDAWGIYFSRLADRGSDRFETTAVREDGRAISMDVNLYHMEFNSRGHAVAVSRDTTALWESEQRLRLVVEATNDGIWDWDIDSGVDYLSPRWKAILGYADDELENRVETFFERLHPAERPIVDEALARHFEHDEPFHVEMRLRHRDGTYRQVLSRGAVLRDAANRPARMVGSITDITGRKDAEERIARNLREKEALLRELHHRTKNNMQVINSMLTLQANHTRSEEIREILKETSNRVRAMAIVHQRIYQSKELSRISLREYVAELARLILRSYGVSQDRVTVTVDLFDLQMLLDTAIPCGLILNELISNALKHAFPGDRKGTIHISATKDAQDAIELRHCDDGVGVPEGFDFRTTGTLGMQTISAIAEHQLQGEVLFEAARSGICCRVRFRDVLYQPRV